MTINLFLGRTKKDGTAPLRIRIKNKDKDAKITCPGIFVVPKYWDKRFSLVSPEHPASQGINSEIQKYHSKIKEVKHKFLLNQIDFDLAKRMLSGTESLKSVREFINVVCIRDKSQETIRNYLSTMGAFTFHTGIDEPLFTDITFNNMMVLKNGVISRGGSSATYNKYLRDIKAICNYAKRLKYIFHDFEFDSQWRAKEDITLKVKTITPEVIYRAINNIEVRSRHKSAKMKAKIELEAVGFWILMFSMRGMYPADLLKLSSHNLDYNFAERIDSEKKGLVGYKVCGNKHVYRHERHKTGFPMKILLSLPPIRNLIGVLRFMVAATHPKQAFLKPQEVIEPDYHKRIMSKAVEEIDFLRIFEITKADNPKEFETLWGTYSKALSRIEMPSFKTARKTFSTTARRLRIDEGYCRTMLGQKDRSISISYVDYDDPKLFAQLCVAHISVLNAFDAMNLYKCWIRKIDELFGSNWSLNDPIMNINQESIYASFLKELDQLITT